MQLKEYIGCYPSGAGYDLLSNGLTLQMVNTSEVSQIYHSSNTYYMFQFTVGLTNANCIQFCLKNGFFFTGFTWGYKYIKIFLAKLIPFIGTPPKKKKKNLKFKPKRLTPKIFFG